MSADKQAWIHCVRHGSLLLAIFICGHNTFILMSEFVAAAATTTIVVVVVVVVSSVWCGCILRIELQNQSAYEYGHACVISVERIVEIVSWCSIYGAHSRQWWNFMGSFPPRVRCTRVFILSPYTQISTHSLLLLLLFVHLVFSRRFLRFSWILTSFVCFPPCLLNCAHSHLAFCLIPTLRFATIHILFKTICSFSINK